MTQKIVEPSVAKAVLVRHWRAILHMRQQIAERRFGLVLGAGASAKLGFPDWKTLILRIASHRDVRGKDLLASVLT